MRRRRGVFGQGGRKRRKTAKVRENEGELEERGQTTATAHPPSHTHTNTHTVVRGSPAVRADHNNTPEKESRGESMGCSREKE